MLSVHWGDEFIRCPALEQINLGRRLIDSGVTLIIGHHPHVLQGFERYKKGIIAYSLGNFVSDMRQLSTRETVVFKCQISKNGINNIDYVPVRINRDYQPEILYGTHGVKLQAKMRLWSDDLAKEGFSGIAHKKPRYKRKVKLMTTIYRLQCYLYFLTHLWKYQRSIILSSFKRFLRRRLEFWGLNSD